MADPIVEMTTAKLKKVNQPPKAFDELLHELLDYNPETGALTWHTTRWNHKIGSSATHLRPDGYEETAIGGSVYLTHRLIWLFVYGKWPVLEIDHRDGNRANNAIANLRDVSHRVNSWNRVEWRESGKYPGVNGRFNHWAAQVRIGGKLRYLGTFRDDDDAFVAILKAIKGEEVAANE